MLRLINVSLTEEQLMPTLRCKYCKENLEFSYRDTAAKCWNCGSIQSVPRSMTEENAELYKQAQELLNGKEFDKAARIYKDLYASAPNDPELAWDTIMCRFGIEYVKKPAEKEYITVVNRLNDTMIFDDGEYKKAMELADANQKQVFRRDAIAIYDIQKKMLAETEGLEPCDVFVCYNIATTDSFAAADIADLLGKDGYKVYLPLNAEAAKLESGANTEPKVFAAIRSSKIMVVVGSTAEALEELGTANLWRRYLGLIGGGANKDIAVVYRDMNEDELPKELKAVSKVQMSGSEYRDEFMNIIREKLGAIKSEDDRKAEEEKAALEAAEEERNKALAELMSKVTELDDSDVDYTIKDHEEYDRRLEMLLKHKRRYEMSLCGYEDTKADFDQLNEQYLEFKQRTEANPLNAKYKEIQKRISEKAQAIESNVYFRKETKRRDQQELLELKEQLNQIQKRLDADNELLGNMRKNVEMRKKQMFAAQASMLALKKTFERERDEIRKFDDIVREKRKGELLMEAEKLKHSVGDKIEFGCWPQEKPIEWTIIDAEDNRILILATKVIDAKKFHDKYEDVTWEKSYIRKFLNDEFYQKAFSDEEKKRILLSEIKAEKNPLYPVDPGEDTEDKIFLLSVTEVRKYLETGNLVLAEPTPYALAYSVETDDKTGGSYWWLRTPGNAGCNIARVSSKGIILEHGFFASDNHNGIRPAMWITLGA